MLARRGRMRVAAMERAPAVARLSRPPASQAQAAPGGTRSVTFPEIPSARLAGADTAQIEIWRPISTTWSAGMRR